MSDRTRPGVLFAGPRHPPTLVSEASDATPPAARRDVWIIYNKLADLSLILKDFEPAREYYDQALLLAVKLSDVDRTSPRGKIDLALAHMNAGTVRLLTGELVAAKQSFAEGAGRCFGRWLKRTQETSELQKNFVLVLAFNGVHVEAAQRVEAMRSAGAAEPPQSLQRRLLLFALRGRRPTREGCRPAH